MAAMSVWHAVTAVTAVAALLVASEWRCCMHAAAALGVTAAIERPSRR